MSARVKGVWVAFAEDVHAEDAAALVAAIKCIRGVLDAKPIESDPMDDYIVETRLRTKLYEAMSAVLFPPPKPRDT